MATQMKRFPRSSSRPRSCPSIVSTVTFDVPTKEMLQGLDALVFDIQDAGARFYTYITTMAYAMEAAAKQGLSFYVLDRPNPINASVVQGPILDSRLKSFTGYFPLPIRHGMTVGELATMFNRRLRSEPISTSLEWQITSAAPGTMRPGCNGSALHPICGH